MKTIKVVGATLNQTPLAWDDNLQNILQAIEQAKQEDVAVLCLPELCISGYGCEDAFFAPNTWQRSLDSLQSIIPHTAGIFVAVGLPVFHQGFLRNCCCVISDQKILGFTAKQFLCNSGIHYEPRWFTAWEGERVSEIGLDGKTYPFGEICFKLDDVTIGIEICEDAWVADRPARRLAQNGADLILNLSASHFAFGKFEERKEIVRRSSADFGVAYLYTNLLGNEAGRAIYDAGTLIAANGELIASGERLSFKNVLLTTACIGSGTDQLHKESVGSIWESSKNRKYEEFSRAVSLGLFDYLRKSGARGFVLSLSGGADSATIACLVRYAFEFALTELGIDGLIAKLPFLKGLKDLRQIMQASLLTVYQASANSGEVTRNAAARVAKALEADHHEISVGGIISQYQEIIEKSLGRKLEWQTDDLTLQNIQARARGPSVWMFANIRNALLLATSNRSEVAVGYATMDGDTCGSISPIAGVDKHFIRQWLLWAEKEGPEGIKPIEVLSYVNAQQPTAELRPGAVQTDEQDLMPYELLAFIERAAILDRKDPEEILRMLKTQFSQYNSQDHLRWVKLFFNLWAKSQWKRERYAPSFHLDGQSLDPKTWCRYPILSGYFKKELSEL